VDVLANWMWQGGSVAIAATIILRASRRMSATTRYHLWWITLAVVLALPTLSWLFAIAASSRHDATAVSQVVSTPGGIVNVPPGPAGVVLPTPPAWLAPQLVILWLAWLVVSVGRILGACIGLRRVKRAVSPFPASRERRLPAWRSICASGRRANLVLSSDVRAASVIGLASPTIAVAPSALEVLDDHELDQIIVHEWAHVQRRDDVARLIQRIIAAVAGLHPAIWWIDRQLDLERETACDDWAITAAGSGRSLAVCLTKLASLPGRDSGAVLMPAALIPSALSTRVTRLLDGRRNVSTAPTVGVPAIVTTVLASLALAVGSIELVITAPRPLSEDSVTSVESSSVGTPATTLSPSDLRPELRRMSGAIGSSRRSTRQPASKIPEPGVDQAKSQTHEGVQKPIGSHQPPDVAIRTHAIREARFESGALPGTTAELPSVPLISTSSPPSSAAVTPNPATPWGAAASAGVSVGRGSQKAAVATAGFFTRVGKSISGSF
jgi:bla regulator protein blaR1